MAKHGPFDRVDKPVTAMASFKGRQLQVTAF
jgi:hypothetical protein